MLETITSMNIILIEGSRGKVNETNCTYKMIILYKVTKYCFVIQLWWYFSSVASCHFDTSL